MSAAHVLPPPVEEDEELADLGAQLLAKWYWDPVQFASDVFGALLYGAQVRICKAVVRCAKRLARAAANGTTGTGKTRVAVKSGQKTGKALALDTPIPTPSGWTTMGDLRVGDEVIDENGKPCRVVAATEVMLGRPCYDLEFSDGTVITADEEHQWWVSTDSGAFEVLTTKAIRAALGFGATVAVDHRTIVDVSSRESVPVRCIQVDSPSHLFLCSKSFIPTHNSFLAALLACWWWATRGAGRVMLTAPTGNQVRGVLWMEVTLAHQKAEKHLLETYGIEGGLGGRIYEVPDRGLQGATPGNEIVGRATNKAENMQGKSGDEMLIIVDEASGVPQKVFESLEGNAQGGGLILLMGNPNQTSGELYDAFHSKEALYETFTLSSEDTPNFREGKTIIKGLALRQSVLNNRIAWGGLDGYQDDPRYQVRVQGLFPRQASTAVIPIAVVERAHEVWYRFAASVLQRDESLVVSPATWSRIIRTPAAKESVLTAWRNDPHRLVLGLDVARFGDDSTVIVPRRGYRIFKKTQLKKRDEEHVCAQVLTIVGELRVGGEKPTVNIDATGGFGIAVAALLRRSKQVVVVEINSSAAADDDKQYVNCRAEMAFQTLDFLRSGGGFEPDSELNDELVAVRYFFDTKNRLQIEDKDEIKKRIGRSPDSADAFNLATYRYRSTLHGPFDPTGGLARLPNRTFTTGPRGS